jgi:predicted metal-dependent hydrolase
MERHLLVDGRIVEYTLTKNARARRISISVYPGGEIRVSMPRRETIERVEQFIRRNDDWLRQQLARAKKMPEPKWVPGGTKEDYAKRKEDARKFVRERIKYFNSFYRFPIGRLAIRNQRTRWGSCSVEGNLNFNYKIITLPIRIADYIIVHELCHIREFNHSLKFWALVERAMPEHKKIRKQLRGMEMT